MKYGTVYVEPDHESVVQRKYSVSVPLEDTAGPVGLNDRVILHIWDARSRPGFDQQCVAYVWHVMPGWVRVRPHWDTLALEPDWDTRVWQDKARNMLTFGWRWQWHAARGLTLRYRFRLAWGGGTDELCNPAWWFRVPGGAVAVFYKRPYRVRYDGPCETCRKEDV